MRVDPPAFANVNNKLVKELRFVIQIVFDVASIYVTSHSGISGVSGTVISEALFEPDFVSQTLKPDEAISEIGSCTFKVIDKNGAFTAAIRSQLIDEAAGLRGKRIRFYVGGAGLAFSSFVLMGTQEIRNASYERGVYRVSCLDIQRSLKTQIFKPLETNLLSTITAADTSISVINAADFKRVHHGAAWTDAPSSTVGYIQIKKEVIRYTGITDNTFTGCTRGVFGTTPETYTVDAGTEAERRERVTEYIYIELPSIKLALAVLTGNLYNEGEVLPDHWHLAVDPDLIKEADFTGIGPDLWKPSDDAVGFPLRFTGLKAVDGKRFLEREIYLPCGVFSPIYSDGRLGLKRLNRIINDAAKVFAVNEDNATAVGNLEHRFEDVRNVFEVDWSFDGDAPRRTTRFIDLDSRIVNGRSEVLNLKFKGLVGGLHTDATIFQILDMNRERYSSPPVEISVDLFHMMNTLEVGDVGNVSFRNIADFTSPTQKLNRAMELQRIRVNHRTGQVICDFFGSTASASVQSPTKGAAASLDDAFYTAVGTALTSVSGLTFVGNTITAGSATLTGNASMNAAGAVYYHNDNLTIGPGVVLTLAQNVQLRVKGFLQVNGSINGVGGGLPGVTDDGHDLSTSPTALIWNTIPGNPGFVGGSRGYDGLISLISGDGASGGGVLNRICARTLGRHTSAPTLMLKYDGTSLQGIPDDMRGTGGAPGGRFSRYVGPLTEDANRRGGAGGAGGAGLVVICRGAALGVNGSINLSGMAGGTTSAITLNGLAGFPGVGGSGGPGAAYILLDGANLSVPDFGNRFVARNGAVVVQGNPITATEVSQSNLPAQPVSAFNRPDDPVTNQDDLSVAALRIQYIPSMQTPVEDLDSLPPAPTGLSAIGVPLANELTVTIPSFDSVDTVEIFASLNNDRSNAAKIYEGRATSFRHQLPADSNRYYWARTRGPLNTSNRRPTSSFFPASATGGVFATALESGAGADGQSIEIQYSSNGVDFHDVYVAGDVFLRQRIGPGGMYTPAIRFVGEAGASGAPGSTGNYIDIIFKRSATLPLTPTGNNPSGWFDTPPNNDGNPCFVSTGEKTSTGELVGAWSTPTELVRDGQDGLPGVQGPGLFTWIDQTLNVQTTSDTITKIAGSSTFDAGAYSMQSYSNGCFFNARSGDTTKVVRIGVSENPSASSNADSIGFSWELSIISGNRVARAFQGATFLGSFGSWDASSVFSIVYDGTAVVFYVDGLEKTRVSNINNKRFFLDVSLRDVGSKLIDVAFGPSGSKGPQGLTGAAAKALQMNSTAQAFSFNSANNATPADQTITFTVMRQNIDSAVTFSTEPTVPLFVSGTTATLSVANFAGNNSVKVTASAEGFSDIITIQRLTAGAPGIAGANAINGLLTNESHTVSADPDGNVGSFVTATGLFKVYQGVNDVSALAAFSVLSENNCTGQINTADNTPIAGQPRGFYRVTALAADVGVLKLQGSFASAAIPKDFTVQRSRAGRAGDGSNLLHPEIWAVGAAGTQGDFLANENFINENFIVLAGDSRPLNPFGTTSPLWECRPRNGGQDGGWSVDIKLLDPTKTYRSCVFFRFNKHTGAFYHGCGVGGKTRELLSGAVNSNPYWSALTLSGFTAVLQANKWYLAVGVLHGSSYTGSSTKVAGVYDPATGQQILEGPEFAFANSTVTTQTQRVYHFDDTDTTHRSWFTAPRFEQLNGNEPPLTDVMGVLNSLPWMSRGNMRAGLRTFVKVRGSNAWDSDVVSLQSYETCHVQFRAAQTNAAFMIGLSRDPLVNQSFSSIEYAWYAQNDGTARIYENGSEVLNAGGYSTESQFVITYNGTNLVYKMNGVVKRTVNVSGRVFFLDSSFFTVLGTATDVVFGVGAVEEPITTGAIDPIAVSEFITQTQTMGGPFPAGTPINVLSVPAKGRAFTLKIDATGNIASDDVADPSGQNRTSVTAACISVALSNGTILRSTKLIGGGIIYTLNLLVNMPADVSATVIVNDNSDSPPPNGQFFGPYFVGGIGGPCRLALQLVKA